MFSPVVITAMVTFVLGAVVGGFVVVILHPRVRSSSGDDPMTKDELRRDLLS